MEQKYLDTHQRHILVSVMMAYDGLEDEIEDLNNIELKEEYFTEYYKAVVRAINELRKSNPIVNDFMVIDFLIKMNFLKENRMSEILVTKQVPFSILKWHIEQLENEYKMRAIR